MVCAILTKGFPNNNLCNNHHTGRLIFIFLNTSSYFDDLILILIKYIICIMYLILCTIYILFNIVQQFMFSSAYTLYNCGETKINCERIYVIKYIPPIILYIVTYLYITMYLCDP